LSQLAVDRIKLEWAEANYALLDIWRGHGYAALATVWQHATPLMPTANNGFGGSYFLTFS
jgi:hypothetical protein